MEVKKGAENLKSLSIPDGTKDVIGIDMRVREYLLSKIKEIYENFGFIPQKTSILENSDVFKGHHGEGEKIIFHLHDKEKNNLALRYDLTVPLARIINMYPDIPKPYKSYQIADSFRDDDVDNGHFREFVQCDADIIGTSAPSSDAEIIFMAYKVLKNLGIENFTLLINNRLILKGIANAAGINEESKIIDMQCAMDNTRQTNKEFVGDLENNLKLKNIDESIINKIIRIIDISTKISRDKTLLEALKEMKKVFKEHALIIEGISELEEIFSYLPAEVLEKINLKFSLARGANYYTGVIFEGVVDNTKIGSVLGGGRYDNLIYEVGDENEPAVGMAIGFERILAVIKELKIINIYETIPDKILIVNKVAEISNKVFDFVNKLRKYVNVNFYFDVIDSYGDIKKYIKLNKYKSILMFISSGKAKLIDLSNDLEFSQYIIEIANREAPEISIEIN